MSDEKIVLSLANVISANQSMNSKNGNHEILALQKAKRTLVMFLIISIAVALASLGIAVASFVNSNDVDFRMNELKYIINNIIVNNKDDGYGYYFFFVSNVRFNISLRKRIINF